MKDTVKVLKGVVFNIFPFLNNSFARDRWVVNHLKRIPKGKKILDAGAGECRYKSYCSHLNYISQDFGEYDGKGDGVGLQTKSWDTRNIDIISDVMSIPVKDSSFDYILCTEVLEHIPYPDRAISEFSRILKPKGRLLLTAPFASQTHFAPFHFCSGFNSYWYRKILEDNNFKILEIGSNGNYFEYVCQEMVRLPFMLKRYSKLGVFSYATYLLIAPVVLVVYMLSRLTRLSENQLCFGFHVLAEKKK